MRHDPVLRSRLEALLEMSGRPLSVESLQVLMERPATEIEAGLVTLQEEGRAWVLEGGWRHVNARRPIRDAAMRGALLRDLLGLMMDRGLAKRGYVVVDELTQLADDLEAQG